MLAVTFGRAIAGMIASSMRWAIERAAVWSATPVRIAQNSSPPMRATRSEPRRTSARRLPIVGEQAIAGLVAVEVVDGLEAVEVDKCDGDSFVAPASELERVIEALHEQLAVRQSGQSVVERGVLELLLEHPALGDVRER